MSTQSAPVVPQHALQPLEAPRALLLCIPVVIAGALAILSLVWLATIDLRTVTENWNNGQLVFHHEEFEYGALVAPAAAFGLTFVAFLALAAMLFHSLRANQS